MARLLFSVAVLILSACTVAARADDESVSKLLLELRSTNETIRLHAIDALGEQCGCNATPEVIRALSGQLKNASTVVRAHAAHAMGHLGVAARPAVESLAPLLADPDPRVRRMAIRAWARIRPDPAVSVPSATGT